MAYREGRLQEAHTLYSEALSVDPLNTYTNAKLYCNRALVGSKVSYILQVWSVCGIIDTIDYVTGIGNYSRDAHYAHISGFSAHAR